MPTVTVSEEVHVIIVISQPELVHPAKRILLAYSPRLVNRSLAETWRRWRMQSETPSIGWEAKTLGANRRNSSSEIATVPGTVDLVELLFSAVLMLVNLVSWL
jgi:hypothetical protein